MKRWRPTSYSPIQEHTQNPVIVREKIFVSFDHRVLRLGTVEMNLLGRPCGASWVNKEQLSCMSS